MELVDKCVKSFLETSCQGNRRFGRTTFERVHGIALQTIERYAKGQRPMPCKYWHIFYEYGHLEKFYATFKLRKKREAKEKVKQEVAAIVSKANKSLIDAYRERLNKR